MINNKLEIFQNGNLLQYIKSITVSNGTKISFLFEEKEIKFIFYKILKLVQNLHINNLYNLNLQLSNIMLDEKYNPIFINLGNAKKCGQKLNNCDIIINEYSPPEFYSEILVYEEFKIDVFNLGIMLFKLLFGEQPFTVPLNRCNLYETIKKGNTSLFWDKISIKNNLKVSDDFKILFIKMISYLPRDRYYIEDILESNWMKEMNKIFDEKSEKLNDIENKVYNKFKNLYKINQVIKEKIYIITKDKYKFEYYHFKSDNKPKNIKPFIKYNNIIQIDLYREPNYLMNELYNFCKKIKPDITYIEPKINIFKMIITEKNDNKSKELDNSNSDIQYSIKLYQNKDNLLYFLNVKYINGNINIFYDKLLLLRNHIETLSKKKNIIKLVYQNNDKNEEIIIFGEEFVSKNKNKCKIIYKNKEYELKSQIKPKMEERVIIKLKIIDNITDMKKMFYNCTDLILLPDIHLIDTSNITNMKALFANCSSLISLPDISKWKTNNISDMSYMFYNCPFLKSLPDISKWNTKNVNNIDSMFSECHSLLSLPDISKWNTSNIYNMSKLVHH